MLERLHVQGFKSLSDVDIRLPTLTVLFGPNAAGKSNLLDAIQVLSRIATTRTLADALVDLRGYAIEAFTVSEGGLEKLLRSEKASFVLESDLSTGRDSYRYRICVQLQPRSGTLTVADEYLTSLSRQGSPKVGAPIEVVDGSIRLRRRSQGKPRQEPLQQNFAVLSDPRRGTPEYSHIEKVRRELAGWKAYYIDPRVAMRSAQPPAEVRDIGMLGGEIAPFLYRLRAEHPKHYNSVVRTMRSLIPSVEDMAVDLDEKRGTLDVLITQDGVPYSSRVVSEGTLRVLALCAIALNPWSGSLLAFEEPENGVHPRRIKLIAQLLLSLAMEQGKQVIVTTHSPLFCDEILSLSRDLKSGAVSLLNVQRKNGATIVTPFDTSGPLFKDQELIEALSAPTEDGLFESLMLRGYLDG
jgi:predicted ATPase